MFKLSNNRDLAFYRLTRFMMFHGKASRQVLRSFVVDMDTLNRLGYVNMFSFIGENEEMAKERARQVIYGELNISSDDILNFRRMLSEFSL